MDSRSWQDRPQRERDIAGAQWTRCDRTDAELLAAMNIQLSEDEGGHPVGALSDYVDRMATAA